MGFFRRSGVCVVRVARAALATGIAVVCGTCPAVAETPTLSASEGALPTGPLLDAPVRPESGERVCSLRWPICVHGAPDRSGARGSELLGVLDAAERAWEVETGALELPAPDPDLDTRAYDLYVVPELREGERTVLGTRDPRAGMDRASAFTLVSASLARGDRCALETAIAAAVARASLFRVSPATDEGSARAESAYFARLAVPCALGNDDGISAFQAAPDRAVIDPFDVEFDRGAQLFFWWLDASYSASPGALVRALWALSPTLTPFGAARWNDEPDGFDVLRVTFKGALTSGSTVEDLFSEFGASRALLGARENGAELAEARPLGPALATRIDWNVDWPATSRRLASPVPLAPTGSSYVLVHHAGAAPGARLRLEASWEAHAAIRWVAVKLDAAGREKGRIAVSAPPRAMEAQATIVDLDLVDAILLVATNVGDPYSVFDPDDEVFEPHGWLLTLASE